MSQPRHSPDPVEHPRIQLVADVYKAGVLAAQITKDARGDVTFNYLEDYLGNGSSPVASTLPLTPNPVVTGSGSLPNFFAGLLPEGQRLARLQRKVKTSASDELRLLLEVGMDSPGDVQVALGGTTLNTPPSLVTEGNWAEQDFSGLAEALDLVAIPGVQEKASAAMLSAPVRTDRGHYIVKFDPAAYLDLAPNEHLHLDAARELKIPVAKSSLVHDQSDRAALLVRRFDRVEHQGSWQKLAFEDAAQLMDIPPADKYNYSSEAVCAAVLRNVSAPKVAARNLYIQFLFAWLTGNGDLHAKNVGILQQDSGEYLVAPIYDIPCTLIYDDDSMALELDGRKKNLRRRHWLSFASFLELNERTVAQANSKALSAAGKINLEVIRMPSSVRNHAEKELRLRRNQIAEDAG